MCFPYIAFFFFFILGLYPEHMEVSRPGVELELQLPTYTTATTTPDPSRVCNLHHSSQQCRILNPLSETRDWTRILMVPSQVHFCCATTGTLTVIILLLDLQNFCPSYTSHSLINVWFFLFWVGLECYSGHWNIVVSKKNNTSVLMKLPVHQK